MWRIGFVVVSGCTTERVASNVSWDPTGVQAVVVDVERGELVVSGGNAASLDVRVSTWGRAVFPGTARARAEATRWSAAIEGLDLALWGRSEAAASGVDFRVEGPPSLGLDAVVGEGSVVAVDLEGDVVVSADGFVGRGLSGSVDVVAGPLGVELDAAPVSGSVLRIEAAGDVVLGLPYGLDYDLEVFPDPDHPSEVGDLGFDELTIAPDLVKARTGTGAVVVYVVVTGGSFSLWLP